MLGKRTAHAPEADHRELSLRSALPLVAAALLFGLGAIGLGSVLPYSIAGDDGRLVTSPSQTPGTEPVTARSVDRPAIAGPDAETIPADLPTATAAPTEAQVAAVFAVGVADQGVSQLAPLADPPTPTPTEPPPTPTPTPTETDKETAPAPTATPTPRPGFIPDAREPGPVKQAEPVTAFFDPGFQQPAPEAPTGGGSYQFAVTP